MDNLDTHLVKWLGSLSDVICELEYVYEYRANDSRINYFYYKNGNVCYFTFPWNPDTGFKPHIGFNAKYWFISNVNYIIIKGSSLNQKSNYEISIELTSMQEEINVSFKSAWTFAVIFIIIIVVLTVILLIGDMWRRKRRNWDNSQLIPENLK